MRIINKPKLAEYKYVCSRCLTEFAADRSDFRDSYQIICSVPTDTGIPKEIIEQHTRREYISVVICPVCGEEINVKEGKLIEDGDESGSSRNG